MIFLAFLVVEAFNNNTWEIGLQYNDLARNIGGPDWLDWTVTG